MAKAIPDWPTYPAANVFPMLDAEELEALADDIAANGLRHPLTLYKEEGQVVLLDGRNRLAACRLREIQPETEFYRGGDPLGFVVSENVRRRHLSPGQKAMLAVELLPFYEAEAKKRLTIAGQSAGRGRPLRAEQGTADPPYPVERPRMARDDAAAATGASSRAVASAKRIAEKAPDLAEKVRAGELPINSAEQQMKRRLAQEQEQAAREIAVAAAPTPDAEGEGWRLLLGDFRERLADLPDGCVDLIVTDPPYPAESLPLWGDLALHARRVLSDQGILLGLTGQIFLDQVMRYLGMHLSYGWCYVQPLPGANSRIMGRHILQAWKPWVAYTKGAWPSGRIDWHPDVLDPSTRGKDQYRWAQGGEPASFLITELCPEGGTVLDPFSGTGTYGVEALRLGRRFIGVEADADRFSASAERLRSL